MGKVKGVFNIGDLMDNVDCRLFTDDIAANTESNVHEANIKVIVKPKEKNFVADTIILWPTISPPVPPTP